MGDIVFAYITVANREEALSIGKDIVEKHLAACVNILDGMTSLYRWEGAMQEDSEVVVIAKTRKEQFDRLKERVLTLHSYDCPCVIEIPVGRANTAYLDWLLEATTETR